MLSCLQLQAYIYRLARHASSFSLVCLHAQATRSRFALLVYSSRYFRVVVDVHVFLYLSSLEAVVAVVLDLGKVVHTAFSRAHRGASGIPVTRTLYTSITHSRAIVTWLPPCGDDTAARHSADGASEGPKKPS